MPLGTPQVMDNGDDGTFQLFPKSLIQIKKRGMTEFILEEYIEFPLQQPLTEAGCYPLAELPENQRLAILFCRQEELSYEEIARVLGCSVSATKSLIHRGRETLKQKLKPYLQSGAWSKSK